MSVYRVLLRLYLRLYVGRSLTTDSDSNSDGEGCPAQLEWAGAMSCNGKSLFCYVLQFISNEVGLDAFVVVCVIS
jgi:hypothetical protein